MALWCGWLFHKLHEVRLQWRQNIDLVAAVDELEGDLQKMGIGATAVPTSAARTIAHRLIAVSQLVLEAASDVPQAVALAQQLERLSHETTASPPLLNAATSDFRNALHPALAPVGQLGQILRGRDDEIAARLEVRSRSLYLLGMIALGSAVANLFLLASWQRKQTRSLRHLKLRRESDAARRRADASFRALIQSMPDVVLISQAGKVIYANAAASTKLGLGRDELVGVPETRLFENSPANSRSSGPAEVMLKEIWLLNKDGQKIPAESFTLALDFDGKASQVIIARDSTERRRIQSMLMMAERMASVGTLAAGVGHEINNPLAFVTSNLDLLAASVQRLSRGETLPKPELLELKEMVVDSQEGAERIRRIVADLRLFSRVDNDEIQVVDLARVVQLAVRMASVEIRHRAVVKVHLEALPPVRGNEGRLGQVFLNLLVNAAHAIQEGAALENVIRITGRREGEFVQVQVCDTGMGIPEANLARIFQPFFTTKPPGQGTGLGLAFCHAILSEMGGRIEVESQPGHGSTFRVLLPLAKGSAVRPSATIPPPRSGPRARILVVDDETLVGTALRRLLEPMHATKVVTSARDALQLLGAETFDVILSDLMMPEMTGVDFYEALARNHPQYLPRLIFMTGGAFTPSTQAFLSRVPNPQLAKPLDRASLYEAIDNACQARNLSSMDLSLLQEISQGQPNKRNAPSQ